MSFVIDHVRLVDSQLDQLQLCHVGAASDSPQLDNEAGNDSPDWERIVHLQRAIRSLSAASASRALLRSATIQDVLKTAQLAPPRATPTSLGKGNRVSLEVQELEWLLVSKAAAQVYGLILDVLLEQMITLSGHLWYWDEVLGSYVNTGAYSVQTSPQVFWRWVTDVYRDARQKLQSLQSTTEAQPQYTSSISNQWVRFYGLLKDSFREHSLAKMRSGIVSPLTVCRAEVRRKQSHLRRLREMNASGLGVLMDEGLTFDLDDEVFTTAKNQTSEDKEEWRSVITKSVTLMDTILRNVTVLELGPNEFEDTVFTSMDDDPEIVQYWGPEDQQPSESARVGSRLQRILCEHLPSHLAATRQIVAAHGKPSRIVRYWMPSLLVVLSSSTLLRIFFNRKAEIINWIRDLGSTTRDFWYNWIVEPLKKVIGTIRHDKDSEVAIMSKGSLEGDRASLERMVLDFAKDNSTNGTALRDAEVADIRAKVREGDLTPVLRAYEKDLRSPFVGTIRGDLIRTLLIQIQKTKVDVEIAVGGIDALLKSQELVFGFVGLTPGLLVCLGLSRWLGGLLSRRNGRPTSRKQGQTVRSLRQATLFLSNQTVAIVDQLTSNIDRILSASTPSTNGMLSYKEHGLLLCEVHILRQTARQVLPGQVNAEFLEELNDLMDLRTGIERQNRVVDRIRWAYSRWLHS